MNLKDFAKPIMADNNFIKASFGGFAGSGKSETATRFIKGFYKDMKLKKPILIIDNEKGSRFLIPSFKEAGIEVYLKDTIQLSDVLQAFELLNKNEIDVVFIDSLSKIWYEYTRQYKEKNRKTFMTLQDWGKILPAWQNEFSDRFVNLNGSCVFTGRGGYTYDMGVNEETKKKEFNKSGVKMKLAGETPFEPDINVWMEQQQEITDKGLKVWREAQIMKDRSGLIDGKNFKNPTYKDFQPVVKYLMNVQVGEVSKSSSNENLAPAEDNDWYAKKEQREILIAEIKGIFDREGLGTGKEEKQLKTHIIQKVFGTTAPEGVAKIELPLLKQGKDILEKIFKELKNHKTNLEKIEFVKAMDIEQHFIPESSEELFKEEKENKYGLPL